MKTLWMPMLILPLIAAAANMEACRAAEGTISFESLLKEMIDREVLARFPQPSYTCAQASSYDRKSVSPDQPTWYANEDWSYFLRQEENSGRKEWVMLDAKGPGCVVRMWEGGPKPKGVIRFYLDDGDTSVIEARTDDLIGGRALVGPPLSEVCARGLNLHLPIPYAKRCKITYDGPNPYQTRNGADNAWYNFNYRTYQEGTKVESFSKERFAAAKDLVDQVQKRLPDPAGWAPPEATGPISVQHSLKRDGDSLEKTLEGPGAIRQLTIRLAAENLEPALRSTVLAIEFDGEQTVWCPVGDFFGCGVGLNAYKDWWRVVEKDGTMTCYWVMPYRKSCKITVKNLGESEVGVSLTAAAGKWNWDDRSMHFHVTWHQQYPIGSGRKHDWNYVTTSGKGVYVGDALAVMNPHTAWWGEGDEKIYVDGEKFPSHFGTGSEDYYGYAWGDTHLFSAPFHAQSRVDGPGNRGHTTITRSRSLDAIPFTKSLRFDMEVWHWAAVNVAYAATTYWYGMPGATAEPGPAPDEVKRGIPGPPQPVKVAGTLEGEQLKILEKTGGETEAQQVDQYGWSGGRQLWWRDAKPGEKLVLAVPVAKAGTYTITANLTKARDYAIVQFLLDDKTLGDPIDLYNDGVVTTGPITLGAAELTQGEHKLTVEITGANEKAVKRHMLGLDYVKLAEKK